MKSEVLPGQLVEARCPGDAMPAVQIGQVLSDGKEELFVVTRLDAGTVFLGPMRAGVLKADLPCEGGVNEPLEVTIQPKAESEMPERAPPLPPESMQYPIWPLYVLAGVIAIAWLGYAIWKRVRCRP